MLEASPRPDLRTMLLGAFIASLCAGALAGIAAILADASIDETTVRVLLTTGALTLYSLAALAANSIVGRRPEFAWLSVLGLSTSAIGLVTALSATWIDQPGQDGLVQAALALLIATLTIAHASLVLRAPDTGGAVDLLRRATVGLGAMLATLMILPIVASDGDLFHERAIAVIAVLFLLGNALVPLVRLMEKNR